MQKYNKEKSYYKNHHFIIIIVINWIIKLDGTKTRNCPTTKSLDQQNASDIMKYLDEKKDKNVNRVFP